MAKKDFHRGTTLRLDTIVYDDDTFTTIKDVTGFTVVGRFGSKTKRLTLLEQAGSVVDGVAGHVRVSLTVAQTLLFAPGELDFQCYITDGGGQVGVTTDRELKVLDSLLAP